MMKINIIGAGLAGLSAALTLARCNVTSRLISAQVSERAQSNLAEGGINAVLNTMGENDTPDEHFADTMRGGCFLADPDMVRGLVDNAPGIVEELSGLGVPFNFEDGHIVLRNFGGQKKKRTAFVKSSTGKMLTAALIDAVRRYEAEGLIERLSHHTFEGMIYTRDKPKRAAGIRVRDTFTDEEAVLCGPVIFCVGGLNGFFEGLTTGTTTNTGTAAAILFSEGVRFGNLEMIQYHPTTVQIAGKRMLISEAARGEGGRLFYEKENGGAVERVYFMEDKYGSSGNLMPRDVVSREMAFEASKGNAPILLDMSGLSEDVWESRLSDLRSEIIDYLATDPKKDPIPVSPGIHYFMGGILVDKEHRTSVAGLYAAGECACAYHGANRLGGNSLLGAIYGGRVAAKTAMRELKDAEEISEERFCGRAPSKQPEEETEALIASAAREGLSILRDAGSIQNSLRSIQKLRSAVDEADISGAERARLLLAEAMLRSADARKESRGAHMRTDYPKTDEAFCKTTVSYYDGRDVVVLFAVGNCDRRDGAS